MKRPCLIMLILMLFPALTIALDQPEEKIAETIKQYVLQKYPQWQNTEIKVDLKLSDKVLASLKGAGSGIQIKITENYPDFKPVGNVFFPLEITDQNVTRKIFARARVSVLGPVVVSGQLIKKGKVIEPADLKQEVRDVALLPEKYSEDINQIINTEAKLTIPANSTIYGWMIGKPPLFRRGSEITVVLASPSLVVKAKGIAQDDGYLNEAVKVQRKETKKIMSGRVLSASEVLVRL